MIRCKLCGKEISREATDWNKKCGWSKICTLCIDLNKDTRFMPHNFDRMKFRTRAEIIVSKEKRQTTSKLPRRIRRKK